MVLQASYLRLVSVLEATVDALGMELTWGALHNVDETIRRLALEKEITGSASWDARRRSFKRHHGFDIKKCDRYDEVIGATDVRNSIAHALGRLTARQMSSGETAKNFRNAGVAEVDGWIALTDTNVKDLFSYGGDFVRDLDAKA